MLFARYKRDGVATKEIPLIGTGFQAYINSLFWYLPFSSPKQAYEMLAKKEMSDENWLTKREELAAEHLMVKAADDLRQGWKAWLVESKSSSVGGKEAAPIPASGITSAYRV